MSQKSFSASERALIGLGIVVPTLALLGVLGWNKSESFTAVALPARPLLPASNAFDTLKVAASQEVEKHGEIVVSPRKGTVQDQPLAVRKVLLEANQPALATLRTALTQPYVQPLTYSIAQNFPEFARDRELARLLYFAGKTYSDLGKPDEAARCFTDAIALGEKLPHGNVLIGMLVGIACESIGRRGLWEVADTLEAPTLRTVIARLEALEASRAPLAEMLMAEKWSSVNELQRLLKAPSIYYASLLNPFTGQDSQNATSLDRLAGLRLTFQVMRIGKAKIQADCLGFWDAVIENAQQPYSPHRPGPKPPTDPLNAIFCPELTQAAFKLTATQTETRLLTVYLALRLYALEHGGKRPDSLEALVTSGALKALPKDPFSGAAQRPFGYQSGPGTLYSVGPDSDDDQGRAIVSEKKGKDNLSVRYVEPGNEGDMVARINTY
jgi:hypothetical protein